VLGENGGWRHHGLSLEKSNDDETKNPMAVPTSKSRVAETTTTCLAMATMTRKRKRKMRKQSRAHRDRPEERAVEWLPHRSTDATEVEWMPVATHRTEEEQHEEHETTTAWTTR
jgi:hypothetical protein